MTINNALTTTPLFFVRSGRIGSDSTLNGPGYYAYYWSRSSDSNASSARILNFASGYVIPSNADSRYYGFSLRCLYAI